MAPRGRTSQRALTLRTWIGAGARPHPREQSEGWRGKGDQSMEVESGGLTLTGKRWDHIESCSFLRWREKGGEEIEEEKYGIIIPGTSENPALR